MRLDLTTQLVGTFEVLRRAGGDALLGEPQDERRRGRLGRSDPEELEPSPDFIGRSSQVRCGAEASAPDGSSGTIAG